MADSINAKKALEITKKNQESIGKGLLDLESYILALERENFDLKRNNAVIPGLYNEIATLKREKAGLNDTVVAVASVIEHMMKAINGRLEYILSAIEQKQLQLHLGKLSTEVKDRGEVFPRRSEEDEETDPATRYLKGLAAKQPQFFARNPFAAQEKMVIHSDMIMTLSSGSRKRPRAGHSEEHSSLGDRAASSSTFTGLKRDAIPHPGRSPRHRKADSGSLGYSNEDHQGKLREKPTLVPSLSRRRSISHLLDDNDADQERLGKRPRLTD